ncbi:MAG: hypothetical protein WEC00_02025 [Dongiaceae bacterium]
MATEQMEVTVARSVNLDCSRLLGFDQGTSAAMPHAAKVGEKRALNGRPIAALAAKVGTKTVITSVATASGFRSTLNDASSDRASTSALTFSTVGAPSIGLDWSHLLGFDQAVHPTAMVGEKPSNPALRAKVGSKDPGIRLIGALSAKVGSKDPTRPA